MAAREQRPLPAAELETYQREGFVIPDYQLPKDTLKRLQELTNSLVAENAERPDRPIRAPYLLQEPNNGPPAPGVFSRLGEQRSTRPAEWLEMCSIPDVLDMTESIIGPDLIMWSGSIFHKKPVRGFATPWHRDNGGNVPIKPLVCANVWIAVFDAMVENGCLRVIPKSHLAEDMGRHHADLSSDLAINLTLSPDQFDESQAHDVELKAGQMVFFDFALIHGARPNHGKHPRAGFTIRYIPATSRFDHDASGHWDANRSEDDEAFRTRPLFLVRGIDRAGNDFRRGHPAPDIHRPASKGTGASLTT